MMIQAVMIGLPWSPLGAMTFVCEVRVPDPHLVLFLWL